MKFIKQGLFLLVYLLTVSIPITTYAAGEGNIDHGGGMLGEGTGINFWSSHDEGVRVTVVRGLLRVAFSPSSPALTKYWNGLLRVRRILLAIPFPLPMLWLMPR